MSKLPSHTHIQRSTLQLLLTYLNFTETNMVLTTSPGITVFPNNSLLIDSINLINRTHVCMADNIAGKYSQETLINVTGGKYNTCHICMEKHGIFNTL